MDLPELETQALAWGADIERWPTARRDAALALITTRPQEARAILLGAARLDDALRMASTAAPSVSLRSRILAAAPRARSLPKILAWRGWIAAGAGMALAASCAAGVLAGGIAASNGISPSGYQTASDPAADAVRLLRPSDMAEG